MKEYFVTHSKYGVMGNDRKPHYENALTFSFEGPVSKVQSGTYNYYRNGELVWSIEGSSDLFVDFADGSAMEKANYDPYELAELYPIYGKYSESVFG